MKYKVKNEIKYGEQILKVNTFEVRIMDFEKSKLDETLEFKYVLDNIQKLFNSVCDGDNYNIKINYKNNTLRKIKNEAMINNIKNNSIGIFLINSQQKNITNLNYSFVKIFGKPDKKCLLCNKYLEFSETRKYVNDGNLEYYLCNEGILCMYCVNKFYVLDLTLKRESQFIYVQKNLIREITYLHI